jgi:hypothetical protein
MGYRRNRQSLHLRSLAWERKLKDVIQKAKELLIPQETAQETFNLERLALSIVVTGAGTDQAFELLTINNSDLPPKCVMSRALKFVCKQIVQLAKESCNQAMTELTPGTVISFDGSWEHRRNARRCILAVMSQQTF